MHFKTMPALAVIAAVALGRPAIAAPTATTEATTTNPNPTPTGPNMHVPPGPNRGAAPGAPEASANRGPHPSGALGTSTIENSAHAGNAINAPNGNGTQVR